MIAALDARDRLAAMVPWLGRAIWVHQVTAALAGGTAELWVEAGPDAAELRAALPPGVRFGPGPEGAERLDCFHPLGAPGVDLRRPETVPHQGWLIERRVDPGIVIFSEPLCLCPRWNTDYVHAYLVIGRHRALLIDTGTGLGDIAARARAICPDLICVHTHGDWDHVGGSGAFAEVYGLGRPQRVPAATLLRQLNRRRVAPWRPVPPPGWPLPPPRVVTPPPEFDLGGRRFQVIVAPGHTADGLALFDPELGDLFSGDALYAGLLYARDRERFAETRRRLRRLPGLRRILGGHGPVPASQADVDQYGQLVE